MKTFLVFLLATFSFFASASEDEPFIVTKSFNIYVTEKCQEGDISCNNVIYRGVNRKTKQEITLKGYVVNVKPSMDFAGYEFDHGDYQYTLTPKREEDSHGNDKWVLMVFKNQKLIFTEDGVSPD